MDMGCSDIGCFIAALAVVWSFIALVVLTVGVGVVLAALAAERLFRNGR